MAEIVYNICCGICPFAWFAWMDDDVMRSGGQWNKRKFTIVSSSALLVHRVGIGQLLKQYCTIVYKCSNSRSGCRAWHKSKMFAQPARFPFVDGSEVF